MAVDFGKLREIKKRMKDRASGTTYLKTSKLGEETDIRLLPPLPSCAPAFYFEEIGYWVKTGNTKERWVSPESFGLECPIQENIEAIEEAANQGDADSVQMMALLKNNNLFSKKSIFYIPILHIEAIEGADGQLSEEYEVVGDKPTLLQANITIINALFDVADSKHYKKGGDGVFDLKLGRHITITKTGTGMDTEYGAVAWDFITEVDPKYMKQIIDPVAECRKKLKTDKELTDMLYNFLSGSPKPAARRKRTLKDDYNA